MAKYPKAQGGGWYKLSNGEKVQGEEGAIEAQALLDESELAPEKPPAPEPAPESAPEPQSAAPVTPNYEEVLAARRDMERKHDYVRTVSNRLRAVGTDLSEFKTRDLKVAEQREALAEARAAAAAATDKYNKLKQGK
jgi:hypothetical protein